MCSILTLTSPGKTWSLQTRAIKRLIHSHSSRLGWLKRWGLLTRTCMWPLHMTLLPHNMSEFLNGSSSGFQTVVSQERSCIICWLNSGNHSVIPIILLVKAVTSLHRFKEWYHRNHLSKGKVLKNFEATLQYQQKQVSWIFFPTASKILHNFTNSHWYTWKEKE